jgi:hypothetical protein
MPFSPSSLLDPYILGLCYLICTADIITVPKSMIRHFHSPYFPRVASLKRAWPHNTAHLNRRRKIFTTPFSQNCAGYCCNTVCVCAWVRAYIKSSYIKRSLITNRFLQTQQSTQNSAFKFGKVYDSTAESGVK